MEDSIWSGCSDETRKKAVKGMVTEKEMTLLTCLRRYPKAIAWSMLIFLTVVMEAFDKLLITGLFALPTFNRRFGEPTPTPNTSLDFSISPTWQMGLQNAAIASEITGLLAYGYVTNVTGYRKMMLAALAWICVAVIPAFVATNLAAILVAQVMSGVSWGIIQTLAATYAAEIVPSLLRAFLLSNINTCWLLGQLIGTGILRGFAPHESEWSYRLPFALQWAWAVPLLVGIVFAPDSPWRNTGWFIRHDKPDDARRALCRLSSQDSLDIDNAVAVMQHTNTVERNLNYGRSTYADLFKGVNRRRTEIACMAWVCQALSGAALTSYAPYFFEQTGFSPLKSFTFSTAMYGVALGGGMLCWALIPYVGRRMLYLIGLSSSTVLLTAGGITWVLTSGKPGANWALGGLIVATTLLYNLTIGPVCYVLIAEVPATRLRVQTVALARVAYNLVTIANNILLPLMLNPKGWSWSGKACFVYAATSALCLVWCYFRLPETRGLSYLELDILFELKAPSKKFAIFQKKLNDSPYVTASAAERLTNPWHGWLAYS
ncbi:hypothetical protein DCS_04994 [Drechmeria coniospora]|uniref:Major facilitator superfamily (MFS) profile domain-containing protein n=1 Tax=Drechmeria coniospora TaxID=98403 RepID=A0A151GLS1_DRECN|nr:hypothetical protein DCS_04994 [Drechmeria coniospora]KYK57981.1 hypothetical protein DCS_04994 [Drechmeria coniospora]